MGKKIEKPEAAALSSDVLPDKKDLAAARTEAAATLNDAAGAYTFDGDRSVQDHLSGAPEARHLVLGEDDPRDRQLEEQVLTEDVAWTGRIFNVDRLQVKLPDGRMAIRDVVRHPGAVAVVALTEEGQICLVRQYRTALGRVTVEIPAGKLAPGEDPLACAERELKEETGFTAQKMAYLTTIATSAGFADELIHIYMATSASWWMRCSTDASRMQRPSSAPSSAMRYRDGSIRVPCRKTSSSNRDEKRECYGIPFP